MNYFDFKKIETSLKRKPRTIEVIKALHENEDRLYEVVRRIHQVVSDRLREERDMKLADLNRLVKHLEKTTHLN